VTRGEVNRSQEGSVHSTVTKTHSNWWKYKWGVELTVGCETQNSKWDAELMMRSRDSQQSETECVGNQ